MAWREAELEQLTMSSARATLPKASPISPEASNTETSNSVGQRQVLYARILKTGEIMNNFKKRTLLRLNLNGTLRRLMTRSTIL
ncbi:MAG: hypothetical protein ACLQAT_23940 [Candidatus Binataceae bacterium]